MCYSDIRSRDKHSQEEKKMKIKNSPSQIKALKDALVVLDAKSAYADFCDKQFDANPEDENAEAAFDAAYTDEMTAFSAVVDILVDLLGIDKKTASTMLKTKRDRIDDLLKRWRS
jgi:hypothetical protein